MVEDLDTALDLRKMARIIDKVGELFEDENLTADEAVWAAALGYLSVFNSTDSFANVELLNNAARALLREASDVFESLPEPGEKGDPAPDEPDDEDELDDEDEDDEEAPEPYDEHVQEPEVDDGTEIPDAGQ
jgi:phosphopantothenoylcysteine synthetase/decarboxylase